MTSSSIPKQPRASRLQSYPIFSCFLISDNLDDVWGITLLFPEKLSRLGRCNTFIMLSSVSLMCLCAQRVLDVIRKCLLRNSYSNLIIIKSKTKNAWIEHFRLLFFIREDVIQGRTPPKTQFFSLGSRKLKKINPWS